MQTNQSNSLPRPSLPVRQSRPQSGELPVFLDVCSVFLFLTVFVTVIIIY